MDPAQVLLLKARESLYDGRSQDSRIELAKAQGLWLENTRAVRPTFTQWEYQLLAKGTVLEVEARARDNLNHGKFRMARIDMLEAQGLWCENIAIPFPRFAVEELTRLHAGEVQTLELHARYCLAAMYIPEARTNMANAKRIWNSTLGIPMPEFQAEELLKLRSKEIEVFEDRAIKASRRKFARRCMSGTLQGQLGTRQAGNRSSAAYKVLQWKKVNIEAVQELETAARKNYRMKQYQRAHRGMAEATGLWDETLNIPKPCFCEEEKIQIDVARVRTLETRAREAYQLGEFRSARLYMEGARSLWTDRLRTAEPSFTTGENLEIMRGEVQEFEALARRDMQNNAFQRARINMVEAQELWAEGLGIDKPGFTLSELQRISLDEVEGIESQARLSMRSIDSEVHSVRTTEEEILTASNRPQSAVRGCTALELVSSLARKLVTVKDECAICSSTMAIGEIEAVGPCSHRYHDMCIGEWLMRQDSCPMCRRKWIEPLPSNPDPM